MSKVVEKKLGQHDSKYYLKGLVKDKTNPRSKILVDPRQSPKSLLGTIIHEKLHLLLPDASEKQILKLERELRNLLWANNYRRVSQ